MSSPPPTVAVDLRALVGAPSGIGVLTRSLLVEMARRGGHRFVGMAHAEVTSRDELAAAGVALEAHPARLGVLWQQLRLPRRLDGGDVDLLWSPLSTLPLRLPVPGVVTVHDLTPVLMPEAHRLKVRLSVLPFLRRTLELARAVAVDSEATARDLRRLFPECADRVRVVYPGIDAVFEPAPVEEIEATRRELDCPDGYLLFAGTLEPRKNVGLVLDAWQALRADGDYRLPLVLAGPYGWKSRALMRRIERLRPQGLHYLGRLSRPRLARTVQAASAFAFPSLYEGFGLPPAEAMACGVPTVVSNRSSLPEVAGDAAIQVEPEDAAALAHALRALERDPGYAADIGERGRLHIRRFTWEAAADGMSELFASALDRVPAV